MTRRNQIIMRILLPIAAFGALCARVRAQVVKK